MRTSIVSGLVWVLLSGCASFPRLDTTSQIDFPDRDTTPVSSQQMQLLVLGDWYAVRLPERNGQSTAVRGIFRNGYVGRLQKSDEDSLTLTEVTKCTNFDSTSALRHLPLLGSNFENGWLACKNEPGTITIPRSKVMWFEPISEETAEQFRRYDQTINVPVEIPEIDHPDKISAPFGALASADFLLPNPKSEEIRSRRWIEVREMKPGQWYNIIPSRQRSGGPNDMKIHVGLVHHMGKDSMTLTNVTTGSPLMENRINSEASSEITLRYSQIDRAIPLTPELAAEQVEAFVRPRKP